MGEDRVPDEELEEIVGGKMFTILIEPDGTMSLEGGDSLGPAHLWAAGRYLIKLGDDVWDDTQTEGEDDDEDDDELA